MPDWMALHMKRLADALRMVAAWGSGRGLAMDIARNKRAAERLDAAVKEMLRK